MSENNAPPTERETSSKPHAPKHRKPHPWKTAGKFGKSETERHQAAQQPPAPREEFLGAEPKKGSKLFGLGPLLAILLAFAGAAAAQDTTPAPVACPDGYVCITRTAAQNMLATADRVAGLENEKKVLLEAVAKQRDVTHTTEVQFARCTGELTATKVSNIDLQADKNLLMKLVRPKKIGLINF